MNTNFIDKVRNSILKNIENETFSVSDLAKELGYSRSQLLRKIKASTGKSVNKFICQIRLEESVKLLQQENLTSSEIAFKVGFSSPSYFNKCFLEHYGVTPLEYRKSSTTIDSFQAETHQQQKKWWAKNYVKVAIILLVLLGSMIIVYYIKPIPSNKNSSLAVLPFLNLSNNNEYEYLVDGLTEAITLELSKNKSIRVISRGSAMSYKGKSKVYSTIAKELGVDLLLEGSVLFVNDSLIITLQLIEPFPKEKHLWQNSYQHYRTGIIELINNVSSEVAHEISNTVTPEYHTTTYKTNYKAYDLYLRGKHITNYQKISEFSLQQALKYLETSLENDSLFAPAYVSLAETYLAINRLIGDNEMALNNREKAKDAVNKALTINPNLAEAYITKGIISGELEWNWDEMKKLALKGLKLDPNNPKARVLLSNYYLIKGEYSKAIEEALKAEQLDPLNPYLGCFTAERYYINHDYQKSIAKYNEVIELHPSYGYAYNGIGFAYFQVNQTEKAIEAWRKIQFIIGNKALGDCYDTNDYLYCLHYYLNQAQKDTPRFCRNPVIISSVFMITEQEQEALKYLKIAYRYKSDGLPIMLAYPDFHDLHSNKEFQLLVKKVGVILN